MDCICTQGAQREEQVGSTRFHPLKIPKSAVNWGPSVMLNDFLITVLQNTKLYNTALKLVQMFLLTKDLDMRLSAKSIAKPYFYQAL